MKYEIEFIPNFGNKEIITNQVKKLNIESTYETRSAGFFGSNVLVIMDIECDIKKALELKEILELWASDGFSIYKRCSECNKIEMI